MVAVIILLVAALWALLAHDWEGLHTLNAEGRRRQTKKIAEAAAAHEAFATKRREHQHWNWRTRSYEKQKATRLP